MSFRKMKEFRPWPAVRAALEQSEHLEIVDGQFIKRKLPLTIPLRTQPRAMPERIRSALQKQDPTYSKNMLKPTGFEPNATQGPITPQEHEADKNAFNPQESFTFRMENAVNRYDVRRKMHQETRKVFCKFLIYGGFEGGRQFTGGSSRKQLIKEGVDEDEIDRLTAYYGVTPAVLDGLAWGEHQTDEQKTEITWVVDFEGVAKGFLSNQFMMHWDWYDGENVAVVTNVLSNFYGYLLLHDACPEYDEDLRRAQDVCEVGSREFPRLAIVDQNLPGGFGMACSTLFGGHFAGLHRNIDPSVDWTTHGDNVGLSEHDARLIFLAGVSAYGSPEQRARLRELTPPRRTSSEELGLEVIRIEHVTDAAKELYNNPKLRNTIVRPMGRLICKRWALPRQAPRDLPQWKFDQDKQRETSNATFDFILDDATLKHCYPGLKMEVTINELDMGIKWIDRIGNTFPSFFTWLPNEDIEKYKKPGPPRAWMIRANMKAAGVVDQEQLDRAGEDEEGGDDETVRGGDEDCPD